jgi:hypothetical protein
VTAEAQDLYASLTAMPPQLLVGIVALVVVTTWLARATEWDPYALRQMDPPEEDDRG